MTQAFGSLLPTEVIWTEFQTAGFSLDTMDNWRVDQSLEPTLSFYSSMELKERKIKILITDQNLPGWLINYKKIS